MKNRFLGGVSFLPLYAPEGVGDGQNDLAPEPQKDDFAASLEEAAETKEENDANDLNHSEADEKAENEEVKEEVTAEKTEEDAAPVKDEDETEQLRKTVKALGKRVSTLSKEKRDLHAKLQENIKPVAEESAEGGEDAPQRSDF